LPDRPIKENIDVTLENLLNGCEKSFSFKRTVINIFNGTLKEETKELKVPIKPGMHDGQRICFGREGSQKLGRIAADVNLRVHQLAHNDFKRCGNDLESVMQIKKSVFAKIKTLSITTLEHRLLKIPLDQIAKNDCFVKIIGHGMPYFAGNLQLRGDLIVKLDIIDDPYFRRRFDALDDFAKRIAFFEACDKL